MMLTEVELCEGLVRVRAEGSATEHSIALSDVPFVFTMALKALE
jgi:hypothetical protein